MSPSKYVSRPTITIEGHTRDGRGTVMLVSNDPFILLRLRYYRLQIELESPSLRLRVIEVDRTTLIAGLLFYLVEAGVVAWRLHFSISIAMIVVAIGLFVRLFMKSEPGVSETRKKLSRFFTRCSSVETLHMHKINRETLEVIRKALKDVPIKNMVIYDNYCDQHLRLPL